MSISLEHLNAGQRSAYVQLKDFIESPFEKGKTQCIGLSGKPGVGKTYLLGVLYSSLTASEKSKVHFTATTNKASQELQRAIIEMLPQSDLKFMREEAKENGKQPNIVTTIYKKLGLILKGYNKVLTPIGSKGNFSTNSIIIIDESSFIDVQLLKYIMAYTKGCKVIFVGDKNQLCPVGMDYTPAYDVLHRNNVPILELTQIMRQKDANSYIVSYSEALRQVIAGEADTIPRIVPCADCEWLDQKAFEEKIMEVYDSDLTFKVLAQSNAKVAKYNGMINQSLREDKYLIDGDLASVNTRTKQFYTDAVVMVTDSAETFMDIKVLIPKTPPKYPKDLVYEYPNLKGRALTVTDGMTTSTYFVPYAQGKTREIVDKDVYMTSGVADLRAVYACTIHKSQGASFDIVFLDLNTIMASNMTTVELARLLYVAVTRAKTKIYLTGSLTDIYEA